MRSLWKGAINFGLVTIPVRMYTATEQKDVRFRLLHRKDGAPIVEKRFCTKEDKEVAWEDLVRGYEVSNGEFVVMEPDEIEAAAEPEPTKTIDIGDFVEIEEIDPIYFEKSYFLEPDGPGGKPFNLLREALEDTGRVAVAKVTIRTKERLATVRPYDGTLLLETMFWPDEIRSTDALETSSGRSKASAKERQMARQLVESLADKFKPESYKDRYRISLQELIEQKMRGESRNAKRRKPPAKVIDLMAALEASLQSSRSGSGSGGSKVARKGARKSTAAKSTAARSSSTKTATRRRSAA